MFNRRMFLHYTVLTAATAATQTGISQDSAPSQTALWHDVREWGVEGKGWVDSETEKYFDRLPKRAKGVVRDAVWNLSQHSAGMLARFRTDADEIWVDYEVTSEQLAMPHMPATGVSGIDLYATDDSGAWRWLSVSKPTNKKTNAKLIDGITAKPRDFAAYLPLYNGTESLKFGVPEGAMFEPIEPRTYANTPFIKTKQIRHQQSRGELRKAYDNLIADGFKQLGYLEGDTLLGDDRDDTTDGSHPNDLGFYRQANAMEPALRKLGIG